MTSYTDLAADVITLCDGYAHIIGTTSVIGVVTSTYTTESCVKFPETPTCSIQPSDCAAMLSGRDPDFDVSSSTEFERNSCGDTRVPSCFASYVPPPSTITTTVPQDCGRCTIYGDTVQLLYFPVATNASKDMCTTSPSPPTVCPFGRTTAGNATAFNGVWATGACEYALDNVTSTKNSGPYTVSEGTTLYKNRAYFSYVGASARNSCGQVGKVHRSGIVAVPSSDVYSVSGYHYDWEAAAHSFNFADLNPPVPASAFLMQLWCDRGTTDNESLYHYRVNGVGALAGPCRLLPNYVIYDESYNPRIALPPQFRALDPAWSECRLQLGGVYDPPKPLQQATSLDTPTRPVQISTSARSAVPAQTADPATAIVTATTSALVSSQTGSSSGVVSRTSGRFGTPTPQLSKTPQSLEPADGASDSSSGAVGDDPSEPPGSADDEHTSVSLLPDGPTTTGGYLPDQTTSPATLISSTKAQDTVSAGSPPPSSSSPSSADLAAIIVSVIGGSPRPTGSNSRIDSGSRESKSEDSRLESTSGSEPGTATTPVALITVGSSLITVQQSQPTSLGGQSTTSGGSAAIISVGASGVVVGGSAVNFQSSTLVPASAVSTQIGTVVVSGSSLEASLFGSFLVLGSQTLTIGGSAITLSGGATASVEFSGNLVLGGSQTVKIGDDLSSVVFTANGQVITAVPVSGDPGAAVVDSSATLSQGGSAQVVNGQTLSLGNSGIVFNGADTLNLPTQVAIPQGATLTIDGHLYTVSQATPSIDDVDGSVVLTAEGSAKTLPDGQSSSATPPVILIDGNTVRVGTANTPLVTEIQGHLHTFSELSPGLQVVDSSITLEAGAAATTLANGEVLSAVSGGAVVDGTSISVPAQYIAMTTSIDGDAYTISRGAVDVYAINGIPISVDGMPTTLPDGAIASVGSSQRKFTGLPVL
ncbi:hypothetical protein LTR27_012826 [Elasticomyces elasticus]|nr:hypothetical protein LTR27_012826 [Elasticomyces elasticus]